MLPRKVITKKQKKEKLRKKLAITLILIGLTIITIPLVYLDFIKKDPLYLSPLSKDQRSQNNVIEQKLKEKKISYISLETSKDLSYSVKLNKDQEVIIDPRKSIDEQVSSLQLILSQLKIEGKTFKRLDFRFQKPIISF